MNFALFAIILLLQPAQVAQTPASSENARVVPWEVERNQRISGKPAVYPSIAAIAHVSGCVYLRIIVSTSGSVEEISYLGGPVLKGIPRCFEADAVEYRVPRRLQPSCGK